MEEASITFLQDMVVEPGCVRVYLLALNDASKLSHDSLIEIAIHVLEQSNVSIQEDGGVVGISVDPLQVEIEVAFAAMWYAEREGWNVPPEFRVGEALNA